MKKKIADILVIILLGAFGIIVNEFGFLASYGQFLVLPLIIIYYIGQIVERKFKTPKSADK